MLSLLDFIQVQSGSRGSRGSRSRGSVRLSRGEGGSTTLWKGVALSPLGEPVDDRAEMERGGVVGTDIGAGPDGSDMRPGVDRVRMSTLDDEEPFLSGFATAGGVSKV